MVAPLGPIGLGMSLGGGLLSGYGQSQGLSSMADERRRQGAEWDAENQIQAKRIQEELARRRAALSMDNVAPAMAVRQGALGDVGATGAAFGVSGADVARTTGQLMPASAVAAQDAGAQTLGQQNTNGMALMSSDIHQSQANQNDRARMYDQLLQQAGQKGQPYRQLGDTLQQTGGIASMAGLYSGSPAAPTPRATPGSASTFGGQPTYLSTGQAIFPMR